MFYCYIIVTVVCSYPGDTVSLFSYQLCSCWFEISVVKHNVDSDKFTQNQILSSYGICFIFVICEQYFFSCYTLDEMAICESVSFKLHLTHRCIVRHI